MFEFLRNQIAKLGWDADRTEVASDLIELALVLLVAYVAFLITRRIVLRIVHSLVEKTQTDWDDIFADQRVFSRLSLLAPAGVIYFLGPEAFETELFDVWARRFAEVAVLVILLASASAALNAVNLIYQRFDVAKRFPILGYLQVVKIILGVAVLIVGAAVVIDRSPLLLLSGLGAMTAVILLIFRDTILGLVAGIQLIGNDMLRPGDWIEMPKYGADGDVLEITLNTVKVQNFDKTITTIPTYALISDSFKNWRGMSESDGRRIKRSIMIDVGTVKFCTDAMIDRFKRIAVLQQYISDKQTELREHNDAAGIDDSVLVNGRRMTNLGTFRNYLVNYLRNHPNVNDKMTLLIRQLQPSENGLPLEIYVFSADKNWINYEGIQSDIFDHIYAALPYFELRAFQSPSGHDFAALAAVAAREERSNENH